MGNAHPTVSAGEAVQARCPPYRFNASRIVNSSERDYATPSFFCKLVDEVVYWNTRRLSGKI